MCNTRKKPIFTGFRRKNPVLDSLNSAKFLTKKGGNLEGSRNLEGEPYRTDKTANGEAETSSENRQKFYPVKSIIVKKRQILYEEETLTNRRVCVRREEVCAKIGDDSSNSGNGQGKNTETGYSGRITGSVRDLPAEKFKNSGFSGISVI